MNSKKLCSKCITSEKVLCLKCHEKDRRSYWLDFAALDVFDGNKYEDGFRFTRLRKADGDVLTVQLDLNGKLLGTIHVKNSLPFPIAQCTRAQRLSLTLTFKHFQLRLDGTQMQPYYSEVSSASMTLYVRGKKDMDRHAFRVRHIHFRTELMTASKYENLGLQIEFLNSMLVGRRSIYPLTSDLHEASEGERFFQSRYKRYDEIIAWTGDIMFPLRYYVYSRLLNDMRVTAPNIPNLADLFDEWLPTFDA